jgi:hypothetical protein
LRRGWGWGSLVGRVEALGELAEFVGGDAERVRGVAADIGDDFVVDVGGDAAEVFFDVGGGFVEPGFEGLGLGRGGLVVGRHGSLLISESRRTIVRKVSYCESTPGKPPVFSMRSDGTERMPETAAGVEVVKGYGLPAVRR